MNELEEKLMALVNEELDGMSGDHGVDHVMNVYYNAIHLAKIENADLEVVKAGVLLHDIGRKEEHEAKGKVSHAIIGAAKAQKILQDLGCDAEFIEKVRLCVLRHSNRHNEDNPETLEEKIVYDADKLDAIGAVGIGRVFMMAGKIGARIHNPVPDLSDGAAYSSEDTAFREYEMKLKHIRDRMYTDEGKRLAESRHEFMETFFNELNDEVSGNR